MQDTDGGQRGPGEDGRPVAGHQVRQLPHQQRRPRGRQRHPHRAQGKGHQDPLPHRRRSVRGDAGPAEDAPGHRLPHQDHGQPGHLRAAAAAGRQVSAIVGGRAIDLRVSTLPTNHGEKIVIRILDSKSITARDSSTSAWSRTSARSSSEQIELPHGILLVTGPTGSGKSTTLYSALSEMDGERAEHLHRRRPDRIRAGVLQPGPGQREDRPDVRGGPAQPAAAGPRHHHGRRNPRRRDRPHRRPGGADRPPGPLDAAHQRRAHQRHAADQHRRRAVPDRRVAERRRWPSGWSGRICPKCKEPYKVPEHMRKYVEQAGGKPSEIVHGAGCDACRGSGYIGRAGIFELLVIDDKFRDMINADASVSGMRRAFRESGRDTLFDDGVKKVQPGRHHDRGGPARHRGLRQERRRGVCREL